MSLVITLILSLVFILVSSYLFYNSLENLRVKFNIKETYVSIVFAAIGSVLPEIIIPTIAILTGTYGNGNVDIGVGAILGGPLILSTLIIFIAGLFIIKQRGVSGKINFQNLDLKKNLKLFFVAYIILFLSVIIHRITHSLVFNFLIILLLITVYIKFIKDKMNEPDYYTDKIQCKPLILTYLGIKSNKFYVILQALLSLLMMTYFSETFVDAMNLISMKYHFSIFILSVIIIPIVTEVQEQFISIMWFRTHKDVMAINIIIGSMMFQVAILPIIGILFTNWDFVNFNHFMIFVITFLAMLNIYININKLKIYHLFFNGMLYLVNIILGIYILLAK